MSHDVVSVSSQLDYIVYTGSSQGKPYRYDMNLTCTNLYLRPVGVGSDIGGYSLTFLSCINHLISILDRSIRIPAGFCGLYGLRPSYGRVPYAGCVNSLEGQDSIVSVLGPLCNSLFGIKAFMQGVLSEKPWTKDPLAVRKPWNEEEYKLTEHGSGKAMCFAIVWNDGVVVPNQPILRGLQMVKSALLSAGHKGMSRRRTRSSYDYPEC